MNELKACPFCGSEDVHSETAGNFSEGAKTQWNQRPIDDALLARAEKLRAALLEIFNACVRADINGELSEYINGDILDQAREALK